MGANNHKISGLMFHMPLDTPMEITTSEDTGGAFANAVTERTELSGRIFNLGGGEKSVSPITRLSAKAFSWIAKKHLLSKSDPLKAIKNQDETDLARYFDPASREKQASVA